MLSKNIIPAESFATHGASELLEMSLGMSSSSFRTQKSLGTKIFSGKRAQPPAIAFD